MSYAPLPTPVSGDDIPRYIQQELEKLKNAFSLVQDYDVLHVAPSKPQVGQVRYADGTDWNPGTTGEGLYVYTSSGWTKL